MGDALAGVASVYVDIPVAGVTTDKGGVVDCIEKLARPTVRFLAELWNEIPRPGFQRIESLGGIVGVAAFVIRSPTMT